MKLKLPILLFVVLACLEAVQAQKKKSADDYFELGEQALEENKFSMALAHFNECLRLDPYYWDAYHSRASAREGLGDKKGALTDYSIYVEKRPGEPEALLSRAVLRYNLGQYQPSREDFLNMLKLPPGHTNKIFFRQDNEGTGTDKVFTLQNTNHANLFNYLGLIDTKLKNYAQASIFFDSALRLEPREPNYLLNLGILKEHLIDTAGALADYQQALKIDPGYGLALHNIAVIKRARGEQNESESLLNDAIAKSPNLPYPYAARAYYRFHQKNLSGAVEDYTKVLELNKEDEESWMYLGMVKEKLKSYDEAFTAYTQAITIKNDFARAWLARGTLLTKLNRVAEAAEDYSVAILWYPEYGLAFYNRAIAYQKLDRPKESCQDFLEAEKLNVKVDPELKGKSCR
jgi:tetratricopeptide (TPR) repeat protein